MSNNIKSYLASTSNGCSSSRPTGLPRTIEEATRRYLANYQQNFVGPASEMTRLRDIAEAKIYRLRQKQPKFFEEKLPTLVNQACSELLTCNTATTEGSKKFHHTHKYFLRILDEFWRSVPVGEVNFQTERERSYLRDKLCQRQLELKAKISELEANEIDLDELGDEDAETEYSKIYAETDKLKAELHTVSIQIAALENEPIEEEIEFEFRPPKSSILHRLTKLQLQKLENIMAEFVKEHKAKRTDMYVDVSIVEGMLKRLDIDNNLFTKEELHDMARDALDSYKEFFRRRDFERRNELYESLLKNKSLRPKEGIIFEDENDISDEVKRELDEIDDKYKKRINDFMDECAKRPCTDETAGDEVEDDVVPQDTYQILESVRRSNPIFSQARIKEEPRDDYEYDLPSDDEVEVPEEMADALAHEESIECADENNEFYERDTNHQQSNGVRKENGVSENYDNDVNGDDSNSKSNSNDSVRNASPPNNSEPDDLREPEKEEETEAKENTSIGMDEDKSDISDYKQADDNEGSDDDEVTFVGVVEPTDKIKHVDLN